MPRFMILIVYDPSQPSDGTPSRQPEHAQLTEEMPALGHHVSGAGLAPVDTFVRRFATRDGQPVVLDGPLAETKEALGGYYIVECSEEEAKTFAARVPVDNRSWIELRRVGVYQETTGIES